MSAGNMSYVLVEDQEGDLLNFHFGKKIEPEDYASRKDLWAEAFPELSNTLFLNSFPQEYPSYGESDMRPAAYEVRNGYDNTISRLKVKKYCVHRGKAAAVNEMPSMYAGDGNVDTLEVILEDDSIGLETTLYYVLFEEYQAVARHAVITNRSTRDITIQKAMSANLDLPEQNYEVLYLAGEWGRERTPERIYLKRGIRMEISDNTGRGSREVNPFIAVSQKGADEDHGQIYGFNLIYSGNHSAYVHCDANGKVRIQQGISTQNFAWKLAPGESFCTPQCVIAFSDEGFGKLSHIYHGLYRNHLIPPYWAYRTRPILLNNWEATYFDFDEERLLEIAKNAKKAGVDLFVVDDGWFLGRNNNRTSLGDWEADLKKLPDGIEGLADKLRSIGLQMGLWIEPEGISPDSHLYKAHPDWVVRVPQREPVQQRWQLVMDLSRKDVQDYLIRSISRILQSGKVTYLKWDMNRIITDAPGDGFYHRYILGYYRILKTVTNRYPQVLFEGCCSGGGRFDPGILAYMPQIWTSDNTDAISRLRIQYATSFCYPISSMSTHVTAVPNKQVGRITSLKTRCDVADAGIYGYELDIAGYTELQLAELKKETEKAKIIQKLVLHGEYYRLRNPYITNEGIWELVSEKQDNVYLMACRVLNVIGRSKYYEPRVRLKGLAENAYYQETRTGKIYGSEYLMHRGLTMDYPVEDFAACSMEFRMIPEQRAKSAGKRSISEGLTRKRG